MPSPEWEFVSSTNHGGLPRFLVHMVMIYIGVWLGRKLIPRRITRIFTRGAPRNWIDAHTGGTQTQSQADSPDMRFQDQSSSIFRTSRGIENESKTAEQPFRNHHNVILLAFKEDESKDVTFGVEFDGQISTDEEGSIDGIPLRNVFIFMRLETEDQQSHIRQRLSETSNEYIPIGQATLTSAGEVVIAHISEESMETHSSEI